MVKRPLKYVNRYCEKCGRIRVELYNTNELICEDCGWNETHKEYENLQELFEIAFNEKFAKAVE